MSNQPADLFETSDLNLASFLLASGCELTQPRIIGDRRIVFTFLDYKRCEALALDFVRGRGLIDARALIDAQGRARDVRDLMLSSNRRP